MNELRLVVPGTPPSGNHYKSYRIIVPRQGKPFVSWYVTDEAEAWFRSVAAVAQGQQLRGPSYEVKAIIYLPNRRLIDLDNGFKVIGDSLQHAGVIDNDKHIADLHLHRRTDRENPRTVIHIRTDQESLL